MNNEHKINYIFKKLLNKPNTLINGKYYQEPSIINNSDIVSNVSIFSQKSFYRDTIPNTAPEILQTATKDNNGNVIENSLEGKTYDNVTKYVKIQMVYIKGSEIIDVNNNITSIAFYLKELQNSIPFTFDPLGSYNTEIFRYDIISTQLISIPFNTGDYIIDHDSGIVTFYDSMNYNISVNQYITRNNPIYISFYKYSGNIGLYPIVFDANSNVSIHNNLSITNNLNVMDNATINSNCFIKKNLSVEDNVSLNDIYFKRLNQLPENSQNKLVYANDNLYFNHLDEWIKLGGNDGIVTLNQEQFVFNHNTVYNILNTNTNISIIEIQQNIYSTKYIILPIVQKTGIEKTIIMGQSISKYNNGHNILLYSKFMDLNGNGPVFMNITFIASGQSIKLMSVSSNDNRVYGDGNMYWQIISGNFDSNDSFTYDSSGEIINTNDSGAFFQPNVNNIQYNSLTALNATKNNVLFNTYYVNINGSNIIDLTSDIVLIELNTYLTENKIIHLQLDTQSGQKKKILIGSSFETYKSSYHILLRSTYLGGFNIDFLSTITEANIKFIKSGQCVSLISISSPQPYYQILHGDFTITT